MRTLSDCNEAEIALEANAESKAIHRTLLEGAKHPLNEIQEEIKINQAIPKDLPAKKEQYLNTSKALVKTVAEMAAERNIATSEDELNRKAANIISVANGQQEDDDIIGTTLRLWNSTITTINTAPMVPEHPLESLKTELFGNVHSCESVAGLTNLRDKALEKKNFGLFHTSYNMASIIPVDEIYEDLPHHHL